MASWCKSAFAREREENHSVDVFVWTFVWEHAWANCKCVNGWHDRV
jgi:hypothetical protein